MKNSQTAFTPESDSAVRRNENLKTLGLVGAAGLGTVALTTAQPAQAQNASTTAITGMITDVQGIVVVALGLAIAGLTAYMGLKLASRIAK